MVLTHKKDGLLAVEVVLVGTWAGELRVELGLAQAEGSISGRRWRSKRVGQAREERHSQRRRGEEGGSEGGGGEAHGEEGYEVGGDAGVEQMHECGAGRNQG